MNGCTYDQCVDDNPVVSYRTSILIMELDILAVPTTHRSLDMYEVRGEQVTGVGMVK